MQLMDGEFPNAFIYFKIVHVIHYFVGVDWLSLNFTVKHYPFQMKADTNSSIGPWEGKSNPTL